jgi:hypothetical protein
MLGFEVAESTVSKYMMRHRGPPSQTWRTFLRNHAEAIAAIDLCVVPTVIFELLFAFVVVGHGRRQLLWFAVTQNPSAEWQYYNEARTHLSLHKDARIPRAVRAVLEMLAVDDTRRGWFHSREERLQHALSSSLLAAHIDS